MNKWTSEQRNHIILLAMATAGIAALIWFGLIGSLQASIQEQMNKIAFSRSKLNLTKAGISRKEQFKQEIETGQRQLLDLEGKMPQGDIFRWLNNSMHEIETATMSTSSSLPAAVRGIKHPSQGSLPAVSYSIAGTAYYRSFGSFVAELENSSPFIRLKGLTLQSVAPASPLQRHRSDWCSGWTLLRWSNRPLPDLERGAVAATQYFP